MSRVDDTAVLFDAVAVDDARISRQEPLFRRPDGELTGPLSSLRVSRRPVLLRREASGAVVLSAEDAAAHVMVDEKPLRGSERFTPERLEAGVLVRFGKYVLVWLGIVATRPDAAPVPGLLGDSRAMRELRSEVARICDLSVSVLLRGEIGAGKETVARSIHAAGPRASRPFVAVNAAALAASTGALELFGERDGKAGTGAHRGYFAAAEGGTLFLDQLAAAPGEVQALLGRALDGSVIQPVGGGLRQVDARVIASAEDEPAATSASGRLKPALVRRFGYELVVPSLRARREDIAGLFLGFLRDEMAALGEPDRLAHKNDNEDGPVWVHAELIARLLLREWPGNLHDLRKAARRFAVFNRGSERASVPPDLLVVTAEGERARVPVERKVSVAELNDDLIAAALRRNAFVVDATAEDLGVSRSWLHTYLNESPAFRKAKDLTESEIRGTLAQHGGDLTATALALCVSRRGLQLQMSRFGIRLP